MPPVREKAGRDPAQRPTPREWHRQRLQAQGRRLDGREGHRL
nr:MAG TPA: hypothetical protein [Bacteriophage sp.]